MVTALVIVGIGLQLALLAGLADLIRLLRRDVVAQRRFRSLLLRRSARIVEQGARSRRRDEAMRGLVASKHLETQRQVQAWSNLTSLVDLEAALPPAGGWAASPDLLLRIVEEAIERRPATVVECGSGLSTVVLALAIEQHQLPTKVISLDHDKSYAAGTQRLLERHGVARHVDVRVAPLAPSTVAGHDTAWYDETALNGVDQVGMLIVDGPPMTTGPLARYPVVPLLQDRFADRCLILVDDMQRSSDKETAARWEPLLSNFVFTLETEFSKHLGVFRRG